MKKVLFLITELQKPVGGLYRFATEFLWAWRKAIEKGETDYEPIVVSMHDPIVPLGDLALSKKFYELMRSKNGRDNSDLKVYEAVRGGVTCYFIESYLDESVRNEFHGKLWEKYRVKSERFSHQDQYQKLNSFWYHVPIVAEWLAKEGEISVIDAQDWLAFPAGFLCKEKLGAPLLCRFHSGEFGRSLGRPDYESPPLLIEAAALMEADYVQGVSIGEAKFEAHRLLPLKQRIASELSQSKPEKWRAEQEWKDRTYEEFMMLEPEDIELVTQSVAGLPNGIQLDSWKSVTNETIENGKTMLRRLVPGKENYVLFIGRPEWRKGIDHLLEAFSMTDQSKTGLVVLSEFTDSEYKNYLSKAESLRVEKSALLYNGWVDEGLKKSLFCAADVIALPSLYEPFGIVTLEGLAADLACELNGQPGPVVVVGDTGGMREVITNGVNGFKIPMEADRFDMKSSSLAKILNLITSNDKLKKTISIGGAERIQSNSFDWNHVIHKVFDLYGKAIHNHTHWNSEEKGETK